MARGEYAGKILEVNLTSGKISKMSVDDETLRKLNANGYPSREKLESVGLSDLARRLYTSGK